MAEGNLQSAQDFIAKAMAIVGKFDVPLAAWLVYATAAELHRLTGNARLAQVVQELSETVTLKLANSLEEPLRQSFLSARAKACGTN
jgi:membrane protein required for beta-lactamase induction